MKKVIIAFVLLVSTFAAKAQQHNKLTKVEFTTLSRGYRQYVTIAHDSVSVHTESFQSEGKTPDYKRKLTKKECVSLAKLLDKIALAEVPELKSPTMKRAFDGALHSSIILSTNDAQSWTHTFDDENPHDKLKPLMKVIKAIKEKR